MIFMGAMPFPALMEPAVVLNVDVEGATAVVEDACEVFEELLWTPGGMAQAAIQRGTASGNATYTPAGIYAGVIAPREMALVVRSTHPYGTGFDQVIRSAIEARALARASYEAVTIAGPGQFNVTVRL